MYKEVEEVSFLPGESILNKKEVYEPTKRQRFRQVVCTKSWAVAILVMIGVVIVGVAVIAAFARPAATCDFAESDATAAAGNASVDGGGGADEAQTYNATNGEEFPWRDVRLPKTLVPQSYDIFLHPNLTKLEFSGTVNMVLRVMEETDVIMFHIKGLTISEIEAKLGSSGDASSRRFDQPVAITRQLEYTTHEQYYLQLAEHLSAGSYVQIRVKFSGKFKEDSMNGFYPSSYTVNGEDRLMANTQFEPTYARQAFPCLDEPALKATFKLSIVREERHITLFNMPLLNTIPYEGSLLLDKYDTSVKMSTYLVAFVVCDFKYLSATTSSGTLVRVFAPEDKVYMGQFALDTAVAVLENYTSFFGHSYKLPKADLVAIPNFEAGAMENWGLITYRDSALLYDPAVSNHLDKKYVALVVAHEVAHQWFGNLVTMEWWDDLWLNEGFATFVNFIGMDAVDHSFDGQITLSVYYTYALHIDGLANSHPIKVPLKDPSEIAAVFDSITYNKGAAIIRMLESVIGRESLKMGLKNYLEEHSFGNAVTLDLWRAWQQVSPVKEISVPDMMDTWTLQMGYPVVTVSWTDQTVSLRQERFLLSKGGAGEEEEEEKYKSPFSYKWIVPFTYYTSAQPSQQELVFLKEKSMEIPFPGNGGGDSLVWLKANKDFKGFYRVNYEPKGWAKLAEQLKRDHSVFSISDRIGLLDDAFTLARSGLVNYTVVLELVQYLSQETSRYVWALATDQLIFLAHRLTLEQEYDLIREMVLSFVRPLLNTLGWDDTGDLSTKQLRKLLIDTAVRFEDETYVDKVLMVFEDWKKNESVVMNNDIRSLVYKTGVKHGSKADWDLVFDRYTKAKAASERESLLLSLPSSRDARVLGILLEFCLDTSKIKSQDIHSIVSLVARNPNGLLLAWRFLRQNWDFFFTKYGATSSMLRRMVQIVSHFNTQFDLDEVKTFFQDKTLGSADQPLKQSLEVIEDHMAWTKTHQETVKTWLRDNIPSPGS